jgi:colanic acid/amylovoran biosynthesis glycosyltransferase
MRIGLVLAAVPGYSETFFRSKINGLKAQGHELILFANGPSHGFDLCRYVEGARGDGRLGSVLKLMIASFRLLLHKPTRVLRFYKLERQSNCSFKCAFAHLIFSSHIMHFDLDWLHFGFGTMALGKENVARAMGAKMAVSLRGVDIAIYPVKHPGCYELMWQRIVKLHVISDDLGNLAAKNGLSNDTPVVKITPAIDVEKFQRTTSLAKDIQHPIEILAVARLHWKKGLEYTLQALGLLKENGLSFHYTIIGEGEEFERLIFVAHQLGIAELVTFAGKKSPEEVKQAMEETDIYLQYSISEGFCNAVLEAQAMGCLCVVSDAEGLPENVLHNETGWVVPKRQPELLAAQIISIVHTPQDKLSEIRLQAVERVQKQFAIADQIRAFENFYTLA